MDENSKAILFNERIKDYKFLCNFYETEIVIDRKTYFHVDGFFYSSKYSLVDPALSERLRFIQSSKVLEIRDKNNRVRIPSDQAELWKRKLSVIAVKRALIMKFVGNSELAKSLMLTKGRPLVYISDDDYWGQGTNKRGKNILGKMLEEIRDDIIDELPNDEYED